MRNTVLNHHFLARACWSCASIKEDVVQKSDKLVLFVKTRKRIYKLIQAFKNGSGLLAAVDED